MIVLVTGQVGLEKGVYLENVKKHAIEASIEVTSRSVGREMIAAQGGDIRDNTILNLPKAQLDCLRRLVWTSILSSAQEAGEDGLFIVNTHSVLRWHHGLFSAIDLDLVGELSPDIIVTLVADINVIADNLSQRGTPYFDLWELMAWREEEIVLTQFLRKSLAELSGRDIPFFIVPIAQGPGLFLRLITEPNTPRIYLSFSVTGLEEDRKGEVVEFKKAVGNEYIAFDPLALSERAILLRADSLSKEIDTAARAEFDPSRFRNPASEETGWSPFWDERSALGLSKIRIGSRWLPGREIDSVRGAIDGQIISRDYYLIDQSDFVLMYISTAEGGKPSISAGSQSEMLYAYSHGKPVYGICAGGKRALSPWVTEFSEVFVRLDEALEFIRHRHPKDKTS